MRRPRTACGCCLCSSDGGRYARDLVSRESAYRDRPSARRQDGREILVDARGAAAVMALRGSPLTFVITPFTGDQDLLAGAHRRGIIAVPGQRPPIERISLATAFSITVYHSPRCWSGRSRRRLERVTGALRAVVGPGGGTALPACCPPARRSRGRSPRGLPLPCSRSPTTSRFRLSGSPTSSCSRPCRLPSSRRSRQGRRRALVAALPSRASRS